MMMTLVIRVNPEKLVVTAGGKASNLKMSLPLPPQFSAQKPSE